MNIAIVTTNKFKYSETFIHNHIKYIAGNIHVLYDGYLPKRYSRDKGLSSESLENYNGYNWFYKVIRGFHSDAVTLNLSIERYLINNKIDLLFCEYGPSGVEMLPFSNKLNIPLIVHFHGYDAYRDDILNTYGKAYPELFNSAKAVISVSEHMRKQLMKLGCSAEKLYMEPCCIDESIFIMKPETKKEYTFVFCGRFIEKKAPTLVIEAFAKVLKVLPDVNLLMIGNGPLLEDCKTLAASLGIQKSIHFKGEQNQDQIVELLNQSFVFVQHSVTTTEHDSEGTPQVIMEAGACGLAVIATYHGGIPELVYDGETGFLVVERDVEAMANTMKGLAIDKELALSMGKKANKRITTYYNIKDYARRLNALIKLALEA